MRAYHFLRKDMTAKFGDEPPWQRGETRTWKGECIMCQSGYHSSRTWFDALFHAAGPVACILDVSKPLQRSETKQVSRTKTLIDFRDATQTLHLFACECAKRALIALHLPDRRCQDALNTKIRWLKREVGDHELLLAQRDIIDILSNFTYVSDAGEHVIKKVAVGSAARAICGYFPEGVEPIVSDAAWAVASAKSYNAKQVGEWDAAYSIERNWQRRRLNEVLKELFK